MQWRWSSRPFPTTRLLRHLGLVVGERDGRRTIYGLHDEHVGVLLTEAVYHVQHVRLGYAAPPGALDELHESARREGRGS